MLSLLCGNGLGINGCECFNLTRSSLKGEALCVFNDKAAEQKERDERYSYQMSLHCYGTHIP
jgi:hypothetical protein